MSVKISKESFGVSADDLRGCGWEAVLATATRRECYSYSSAFCGKVESLCNTEEEKKFHAFQLLSAITSFWLNCDNLTEPFGATMVDYVSGRRPCLPEDLSDSDLTTLSGIHTEISDAEFRARVGDLLWETRKDFKAAQIAIEAYIESSLVLETGDLWPPFAERLQRALQLGAKLGWRKPYHEKAIAAVEAAIARHEGTDKGVLCAHLMELLHRDEVGDAGKYAALSERLAQQAEAAALWDIALGYWQAKKAWDGRRKDEAGAKAAGYKIVEMYRNKAEAFTKGENVSFMSAAFWMEKVHNALQSLQADAKQIEAAHKLLLDYQQRSMAEMTTIQVTPDRIPGMPEKLEAATKAIEQFVSGVSFEDAILRFVCVSAPSDTDELRKRAENSPGVFSQLFGSSTVRSSGQTSGIAAPLSTEDPNLREDAVMKQMYMFARTVDWNLRAVTYIEPARRKILAEHRVKLHDLQFVVEHNPFVPAGREGLFLRGLHAGLHGDLVLAMHLLLPQIENSIRTVFIANGGITSKLESDKTQDERDLGWLLTRPEMAQYFGKGMAFDLRGLLVERFGLNIRNDLFHGLLDIAHMSSEGALYIWWLTLRICCTPILNAQQKQHSP